MASFLVFVTVFAALAASALFVYAGTVPGPDEDDPLYPGAAPAYQATQAYWQGMGQASDWESLKAQVRRWRQVTAPGCSESEVEQVARHLNRAVFRFEMPTGDGFGAGQHSLTSWRPPHRT